MQPLHLGRFLTNKRCGASREGQILSTCSSGPACPGGNACHLHRERLWVCRYPGVALFARECHRIGLERRHHLA